MKEIKCDDNSEKKLKILSRLKLFLDGLIDEN
jgi:hypothetical protein